MSDRVPFRKIVDFALGGGWGEASPVANSIPVAVVRGTDFSRVSAGRMDEVPRRWEIKSRADRRLLSSGDLILEISGGSSAKGQSTGRSLLITPDILDALGGAVIPASFCRLVRVDTSAVLPKYASYALQDMYRSGRAAFYENQSTGISNFQFEVFLDNECPRLPPLHEQEAVVSILGALDDKIAVNERIAAVSLELAKASYLSARPSEPRVIGSLAQVFDGPHATPKKVAEGPWFLSISSLQGGLLELSESAHISEEDFPIWTRRVQPTAGDVLFSYETRLGEAALMPSDIQACLGRRMALLRSTDPQVSGAMLLHAFLGMSFQEEIKRRTIHGATVDRIPLKELSSWSILLPPTGILGDLSSDLRSLHQTIEHAKGESQTLAALRDALLPQLMSGRLRVKDAEKIVEDHV
ncbi:hypothetical protein ACJ6WF_23365 [Streptomyces sp. MMS24-I2-30]|uniref:hypothetical protein n=1 Tax=Streptomyces sp. MMS24-I2-30 TaxID=3351564 RepID=UPI003896B327